MVNVAITTFYLNLATNQNGGKYCKLHKNVIFFVFFITVITLKQFRSKI